jgi:acetylornithine deacetylase/succinyl-diaminopimelate desuccinylase-like protein
MKLTTHRTLELAIEIQQIPAPTFDEYDRARKVELLFRQTQSKETFTDAAGNVYGLIPGGEAPPLVISAHLDTVFPRTTPLTLTRTTERVAGPGIGDNSLAVAALFDLRWLLEEQEFAPPGNIWLVANVGEEGLGDLKGMRAVVDHFGAAPTAYLILEGMGLGTIYHRALGVSRYRIRAAAQGGHSWSDYGAPSAIHELAELITRLTRLEVPSQPRASLNVGMIEGGTSINTIAPHAACQLDLRSEDQGTLANLVAGVESIVNAAPREGVAFSLEPIGNRPAGGIPADDPLVRLGVSVLNGLGLEPKLSIGSTDANIPLSRGLPAICIGLTTGGGGHTVEEFIDVPPLENGLAQLLGVVRGMWGR